MYEEKRILENDDCILLLYVQTGMTPLYFASSKGHPTVVELLLQNVADVNICKEV